MNLSPPRERADRLQRSHPPLAFTYAVIKKFGEDSSGNLAVLITYYAFFSIFPLLLVLFSVVGFLLGEHPDWQRKIEDGALSQFRHLPLINHPLPQHGSVTVIVIGTVLALYSGLGVAKTAMKVWDTVYGVAPEDRPGTIDTNLLALRLVVVGGLGLVATTILAGTVASGAAIGLDISWALSFASYAVSFVLNTLLFSVIFRWLTVREVTFKQALPGAVLFALSLVVLQVLVPAWISHQLARSEAEYGEAGAVLVLLGWFYVQAQLLVLSAQINVVKQDHLWPRSLVDNEPAAAG
ncbi:MAG TPA: YhjD/YihY/BrkB family envelope integrity protein [Mycobacteriales bacterium]|nr:YhjD/YihY/BrkB family envelope integrity protein [Mycobacteriales bacterium]